MLKLALIPYFVSHIRGYSFPPKTLKNGWCKASRPKKFPGANALQPEGDEDPWQEGRLGIQWLLSVFNQSQTWPVITRGTLKRRYLVAKSGAAFPKTVV
jgi:hypothetical protein